MPISKSKTLSSIQQKKKGQPNDILLSKTANLSLQPDRQSHSVIDEDDLYRQPIKRFIKPENQLDLRDEQLNEEFTRVLTATDSNIASNTVKYNYKEKSYKQDPEGPMDHLAFHFQMNGSSLFKESEEANQQIMFEDELKMNADQLKRELQQEAQDIGEEGIDLSLIKSGKSQFNYSERAAQTFNNSMRSRGVETEPPPVIRFVATVTQWDIFDTYMDDHKHHLSEEENIKKKASGQSDGTMDTKISKETDMVHSEKMSSSLKVLERMVNQNAEDDIFQDFKYWEDLSDSFRAGLGSLLPLWRFSTERCKRKHVTALKWNLRYNDLFAVGYGSYDFMHQGSGVICCYSLKNTSHPEYIYSIESGVMCLDFHPQHNSLIAVGCYDGNVMVFDVRIPSKQPLYCSSIKTGKHTDPVWQVRWQEEELGKDLNFFSISSDGQVASWYMSKNELKMEPVMQLKLARVGRDEPDEMSFSGLAGGCCFDFSRMSEHLFLVGTEEGKIHKCSKAYSGQYLETYNGHNMAIYALKWNPYHPNVFISCSADWNVRIWEQNISTPIFSFDLGNSVGDVAWAPYSSTTFAAVTSDGKVYVFDLSENKYDPLCEQKVVKRAKLTHISFNNVEPIIVVGDDRGGVISLKLSPNLRKVRQLNDLLHRNLSYT